MSLIKGIKKGKTIKLLEDVNIPDNQEIIIDIKEVQKFPLTKMRPSGLCEGEFLVPDNFDDPLPEEILQYFEGLKYWIDAGKKGHITWGILHFKK